HPAAISVLNQLVTRAECPMLAHQWLGYFFRFVGKEARSLEHSRMFAELFPDNGPTLLNEARAHAQLFGKHKHAGDAVAMQKSKGAALTALELALKVDSSMHNYITTKLQQQKDTYSFVELEKEPDFKDLLKKYEPAA